jgi:hypothetical protein
MSLTVAMGHAAGLYAAALNGRHRARLPWVAANCGVRATAHTFTASRCMV